MSSLNSVTLLGNLCRDPELRYTPKGSAIASFSLAVNRQWKDESGADKEEVSFIDCTAWSKTAELIGQYYKKGSPILFEGRLKQDSWDDKQTGQKRTKLGVVVEKLTFLPRKPSSVADSEPASRPSSAPPNNAPEPPAAEPATPSPAGGPIEDQDVPF